MWPFPQPQFKSARKGARWEFRSNCKRSKVLPVTNTAWGGGRNSNCCSTLTQHSTGQGAGSCPCSCSCPNPVGGMPNRAPDGSHFEEKGGKDSKQQLKLFREKEKRNECITKEDITWKTWQTGWMGAGNGKERCREKQLKCEFPTVLQ